MPFFVWWFEDRIVIARSKAEAAGFMDCPASQVRRFDDDAEIPLVDEDGNPTPATAREVASKATIPQLIPEWS